MEVPEVKRLKSSEEENIHLKSCSPNPCWIRRRFRSDCSESSDDKTRRGKPRKSYARQRVCRKVVPADLSLSICSYSAQRLSADVQLSGRITGLALERWRFGYRRISCSFCLCVRMH